MGVFACSGNDSYPVEPLGDTGTFSHSTTDSSAIERRVRADAETPVQVQASPNAVCTLSATDDPAVNMKVFADGAGWVRFDARIDRYVTTASMQLRCVSRDDQSATTQILRFRPSTSDELGVSDETRAPSPDFVIAHSRPALSGDPMSYTQDELTAGEYPMRPDPVTAPGAYAKWLRSVSSPGVRLAGDPISQTGVPHAGRSSASTKNSNNWSGFEIFNHIYKWIEGDWQVPSVTGDNSSSNTTAVSAEWIGMDGDRGYSDIIQDGTLQNAIRTNGVTVTTYAGWFEYSYGTSGSLNQLSQSQFPCGAGDSIYAQVWDGDSAGHIVWNGGYGWFYLENDSVTIGGSHPYYSTDLPAPSGTSFAGATAEWIMEREIWMGNQHPELADYGTASMTEAFALDTGGHFDGFENENPQNITMVGLLCLPTCLTLATVADTGSETMQFTWHNFQ
jgi:hypothetical protein